jgi:hypothetical protein
VVQCCKFCQCKVQRWHYQLQQLQPSASNVQLCELWLFLRYKITTLCWLYVMCKVCYYSLLACTMLSSGAGSSLTMYYEIHIMSVRLIFLRVACRKWQLWLGQAVINERHNSCTRTPELDCWTHSWDCSIHYSSWYLMMLI